MALALAAQTRELPEPATRTVDYRKDIAPVLQKRCLPCHGPVQQQSGLRLDSRESALRGGYSGPAILPGNSAGSRLIRLVAGLEGAVVMPPGGPKLAASEVSLLRAWIDQGVPWPAMAGEAPVSDSRRQSTHWAFQPVRRPAQPQVKQKVWVRNPIDNFVLAKLEAEGIAPSPEADKTALIRRLSLDLTGLPPSPSDVETFLDDRRPDAYERLVDRLLSSPHYGEKWALHWLDQARYADSDGYEKDSRRPHAWRWREWVIDALNADMPFDRFTIEQIAGDLLPHATVDQKVATGFHRNTPTNREGGVNIEMFRFEQVVDRASTVGTVWLGLTLGCAQCHDHKYDPISQKDFYQVFAFFNNSDEVNIEAPLNGEMGPYLASREDYYRERYKLLEDYGVLKIRPEWEKRSLLAAENPGKWTDWDVVFDTVQKLVDNGERVLRTPAEKRTRHEEDAILDHLVQWYHQAVGSKHYDELKFKELGKKLAELKKTFSDLSQAQTLAERGNRASHVHIRGSWKDKGIEVQPATPALLHATSPNSPRNRLTLARWIVSPENPLTSRVIVNRYWQELFGRGIVDTPGDFGTQGAKPSHPELLDWLAAEFEAGRWSVKKIQKLIVTSATYRQASKTRPELASRDPQNKLLARQSSIRLPAELIRDASLAVSGLLDPRVGGKSVEPYLPASLVALTFGSGSWVNWNESQGRDRYRRGIYIHRQRTLLYPLLANFDAPNPTVTACKREVSNTPLQALNLLNDPVFLEMARGLANRVLNEVSGSFADRLRHSYMLALGRPPLRPSRSGC